MFVCLLQAREDPEERMRFLLRGTHVSGDASVVFSTDKRSAARLDGTAAIRAKRYKGSPSARKGKKLSVSGTRKMRHRQPVLPTPKRK